MLVAFLPNFLLAQEESEAIKNNQRVNYIYNFTNYITWDISPTKTKFVIGLMGAEDIALLQEFKAKSEYKQIKELDVEVKTIQAVGDIQNIDLLYIYKSYETDLDKVLLKMYDEKALLVTEGYPFNASMINFIEIDNEFQFEINEEKINKASLLVDPALSSFSIQSTVDWQQLYDRLQNEIEKSEAQEVELKALAAKIEKQKIEIKTQEKHLQATIEALEQKSTTLEIKDKEIQKQQKAISAQIRKLNALKQDVEKQNEMYSELQLTYHSKMAEVREQMNRLNQQDSTLSNNQKEIEVQQQLIKNQEGVLGVQASSLERQKRITWILVLFGITALFFLLFIIRANNKRRKSEAELKLKNEQLHSLNESLDSFTYRVSHDLKAPITNIKSLTAMLKQFTADVENPIVPEIFGNLDRSTSRLKETVEDLLELNRMERIEEVKETVNLESILADLMNEFKTELDQIGAKVILDLKTKEIFASKTEFKSILQNLFTNSLKYRSEQRSLEINVSSHAKNGNCLLTFGDNGKGIDLQKHKEKLFNMFQRFTSDNSISGTGVGMYIIKKLIDKNQGKMELSGGLEKGLVYHFELPIENKQSGKA